MDEGARRQRVVYLLGAGATHACVKSVNSAHGTLMRDLAPTLAERVREVVQTKYPDEVSLRTLVNDVIDERTDFEHVITFLDESSSGPHKKFAEDLRQAFERVLREKLDMIEKELGEPPVDLYDALLDMHEVPGLPEVLQGFLTLNYDSYLEEAIGKSANGRLDAGVSTIPVAASEGGIRVLKLHGSFGWAETWPITTGTEGDRLWIPPGIQKAKERYPFNLLWGQARELLDCDVLRVIGCRLGANDWDLISLLFTTRHTSANRGPYQIEIIDAPRSAQRLQTEFPYLGVQSILEVEPIGSQLLAELIGDIPRPYRTLTSDEQKGVIDKAGEDRNWFRLWLKHKAEAVFRDLGSVTTERGVFEGFLEAY